MSGDILFGFSVAFTMANLFYCFMGVLFGTLVGVLPGLGPVAAMSLLFPVTLHIPPVSAMIMLAGVYYGAKDIDGVRVVSPVQVYLDLRGFRGRGEEAAVKLLDEVIRPRW